MTRPTLGLARLACFGVLVGACSARTAPTQPTPDPPAPRVAAVPAPDTPASPEPAAPLEAVPPTGTARSAATATREADAPADGNCAVLAVSADPIRTVALMDAVSASHAPSPTNASERLLFRQLYETLVRVDCDGRLSPGLAASWRLDQTGRTWIVTLDDQARFSDGTPVTTADIVSSWGEPGRDGVLRRDARGFVESVVPINARVVGITLRAEGTTSPRVLADAALAITKRLSAVSWPLGTTAFQVRAQDGGVVTISPVASRLAGNTRAEPAEPIRFLVAPGADPRDSLDEQVDLLVSRDPSVLAYASTLPDFTSVPLPWLRTHVLLTPADGRLRQGAPARSPLAPATRQTLAADAVRGEARGAEGPFWWEASAGCSAWPATRRSQSAARQERDVRARVVFRVSDTVAGDLAERLVGLATFDDPNTAGLLETLFPTGDAPLVSAGLDDAAFEVALASGRDRGYVVGFERRPLDRCQQLRALAARAGWLARPGGMAGAAVVPLVDTRTRAVVRQGRAGLTIDWDGGLVLAGVRVVR